MYGKYTVHPVGATEFHWNLTARDAQTMLTSQVYAGKAGAESGIASCRIASAIKTSYERRIAHDKSPYYVLKAANGEIIGTSQMFTSEAAREQGIVSCMEGGPIATTTYAPIR